MEPALVIVILCLLVGGIKFLVDMLDAKERINKTALPWLAWMSGTLMVNQQRAN